MIDQNRTALRASARIRDRLVEIHREVPEIAIPDAAWQECQRIGRGIAKAHEHGWHWAVRRLRGQLAYAISICRRRLEEAQWQFDAPGPDSPRGTATAAAIAGGKDRAAAGPPLAAKPAQP